MHRVNPNYESDAKLISVVRRLEALELSKRVQSSTPEPSKSVMSPVCVLCDSQNHLVEQSSRLPIIKAEQENVLNKLWNLNFNKWVAVGVELAKCIMYICLLRFDNWQPGALFNQVSWLSQRR